MSNDKGKRLDRFCALMTRRRFAVLMVSILVSIIMGFGIFSIHGEVMLYELFPLGHPYLKLQHRFFEVFGSGGSGAVIALKARDGDIFKPTILTKVQQMNQEVELWDEIYRSLTVSIANRAVKVVRARSKGEISIEPLMWPDIPQNDEEMELLRKHIFSNPAYNGTLVSRDGTATLLRTEFRDDISYEKAFSILRNLADRYTDDETSVHIVGFPMMMGWIYSYKPQIITVSMVSVGLMLIILLLIFRNIAGIMAPIAFGIICTAMGLGFIGWTAIIGSRVGLPEINFSPLLYVLAFLVGARMVSHSVQLTHRYFEELARCGNDKLQACYETMRMMLIPNWAGVTTDAAGFLVLIFAQIILMKEVAVFMSFWMLCIGLCGILTPILCSYMPLGGARRQWEKEQAHIGLLDRFCLACAVYSIGPGRTVVAALCAIGCIFCIWQASDLKIGDPTPGTPLLWPDHEYNLDQELVDSTFDASSENFTLFYEGSEKSVYDPEVLKTFEAFSRHMKKELPDIYKSSASIGNMAKMLNMTLRDGDQLWYMLPRNERLLTGVLAHLRSNADRGTLSRFIDTTSERAQVTLFFSDHTSDNLLRIKEAAYKFFENNPATIEKGEFLLAGGRIGMEIAVNEEMKRSHAAIDSMVLAAIFILCSIAFQSVVSGIMLTAPLVLANLVAFAYMALNGIGLSINTLPVAAVGVGVGVDFAIYIYSRCIDEFPKQDGWNETIIAAVRTSGKAVVYTGLTMVLPIMTWYVMSDLKFQAQMGMFLAIIIGVNVILALTLHPLMIATIKPAFIRQGAMRREGMVNGEG